MSASEIVVLFLTDVEGSSPLWQAHPWRMGDVIDCLDELVLGTVTAHGGILLKSRGEGDSHFACFSLASRALLAAADLQRRLGAMVWPDGIELQLRVALHAGEVKRRELDQALGSTRREPPIAAGRCTTRHRTLGPGRVVRP